MALRCDLHLHSCLSPCGDGQMTPANIAGFAKLAGLDLIALTDHNSAENLPAIQRACDAYGLRLLPGLELNTAEEIHLLCYLPTVEAALTLSREVYPLLPNVHCDEAVFGSQQILDEEDRELGRLDKLLVSGCALSLAEAADRCRALGGVPVPAHIDRESYSVLSVLGLMPDTPAFEAVELRDLARFDLLVAAGRIAPGYQLLTGSDAHYLEDIAARVQLLDEASVLWPLIAGR